MKLESGVLAIVLASLAATSTSFQPNRVSIRTGPGHQHVVRSVTAPEVAEEGTKAAESSHSAELKALTTDIVSKLRFREVQKELELRELDTSGTFTDMRTRLKELATDDGNTKINEIEEDVRVIGEDALNTVSPNT